MRIEEEKFLYNRIFDDFCLEYPNGVTLSGLVDGFFEGKIALQFQDAEGTQVVDEECVKEIKKVLPFIQRIVEKPRSFIESREEKVPVETAKRISHNAIMHLGRDSNDWHARTFLTVKPKNIISDINEETIDLYENRFVKTLIDRILSCITQRRIKLENMYNRVEDRTILEVVGGETRNDYFRYEAESDQLLKTLAKDEEPSMAASFSSQLRKEIDDVKSLEKKVINLKYSEFYNVLRKCRKVANPISKTNIIMFDQNYNRCYKLWEYLNIQHEEEDFSLDEAERKAMDDYYFAYVVFNVIASMRNSGYEENNNPHIIFKNYQLTFSTFALWEKNSVRIKMSVDPLAKKITLALLLDEVKDVWDIFEIYSDFTDFEGKGKSQVFDITNSIIKRLSSRVKHEKTKSKYCFVSLDINGCSVNNDYGEALYRRFFNIGDNYSAEETDLEKKSNYKTGIQILTPLDVRYNFLHIQRIVNSHVLRSRNYTQIPSECPLCDSTKTKLYPGGLELDCYDCGHKISISSCSSCGEKNILWIKYANDVALKKKEVTESVKNKPYYFQLMKYETIMGQYAISSFRLEQEKVGWKLKSICPNCGVLLGTQKNMKGSLDNIARLLN